MMIDRLHSYFVPAHLRLAGTNEYFRSKTLIVVSLCIASIVAVFFFNRIRLDGIAGLPTLILGVATISIFAIPFLVKLTESVHSCMVTLILVLMALILGLIYTTGGPLSPSMVFIPLFPLGASLFISIGAGIITAAIFTMYSFLLYWVYQAGLLPEQNLNDSSVALLHVLCTVTTTIIFGILGVLHINSQNAMHRKLEDASRAKSDFLSGMSHELRTPLNSIIGFSDLLNQAFVENDSEKQSEYTWNILESSQHLLSLVNDLLDINKIESREMELNAEFTILDALILETIQMVVETAKAKDIQIDLQVCEELREEPVFVDRIKFKQILLNLLSNAIKFGPEGSLVTVGATLDGENALIAVSDQGDGITHGDSERIFQKFFQVNNLTTNKTVGTGLGLPISKAFAELHGGSLVLEQSGKGVGASFRLTIPLGWAQTQS